MSGPYSDVTSPSGSSPLLRQINDRAALGCLFLRGRLTRPELVELTGLSKPTASHVIKRLQAAELVTVVGQTSGGPGPRADVYALNPDARYGAAVSITEPDGLAVSLVDLTGEVRHEQRHPAGYADRDMTDLVADAVRDGFDAAGLTTSRLSRVHIAVPGSYDARNDTVRNVDVPGCDRPGWPGRLSDVLSTPVEVDNDVNLAALAERHHGAGGRDGFALLWLGERGIGLGIDIGGGMLHGFNGAAGEIGYLPVTDGRTLQDVAGGPALRRLAAEHGIPTESAHDAIVKADDALTHAIAEQLAPGLAAIAAVTDPARVVLSGEIGMAGGTRLCEALSARLTATPFACPVVLSTVGGDAVLRGTADAVAAGLRDAVLAG